MGDPHLKKLRIVYCNVMPVCTMGHRFQGYWPG